MKKSIVAVLAVITVTLHAQSPRTISRRNMVWSSVVVNYKFNSTWSLVSDGLFRFEYTDGDIFQWGLRAGIAYKTRSEVQFIAGLAYAQAYPNPNGKVPRPEIRPWLGVTRKWEIGKHHVLSPALRVEDRHFREYAGNELAEEYTFHSFRARLRVDYAYNIGIENQRWSVIAGNEFMVAWRTHGYSAFDQNRAWAGFGHKFTKSVSAQLAYLLVCQQRNSTNYDLFHVIRLGLQFNFAKESSGK